MMLLLVVVFVDKTEKKQTHVNDFADGWSLFAHARVGMCARKRNYF